MHLIYLHIPLISFSSGPTFILPRPQVEVKPPIVEFNPTFLSLFTNGSPHFEGISSGAPWPIIPTKSIVLSLFTSPSCYGGGKNWLSS